jgi:hypothetical protein
MTPVRAPALAFLFVFACFPGLSCGPTAQQAEDPTDLLDLFGILYFVDAESGQCVQSNRQGSQLGQLTCSSMPRALCNVDRKRNIYGNTIVSSTESGRYVREWRLYVDDQPECLSAFQLAAASPAFQTTSASVIETRSTNNAFTVIESCDSLNHVDAAKRLDRAGVGFYFSPRGFLAAQALQLNSTVCLNGITTAEERALLSAVKNGDRVLETTCIYGLNAIAPGLTKCNASEKAIAAPFDFTTPF